MAGLERYSAKTIVSYNIGDIGPGGGWVFITPSTSGNTTGQYFEIAPIGAVIGGGKKFADTAYTSTAITGADGTAIGTGRQNTLDIIAQGSIDSAANYCATLFYGGKNDWFLPSTNELLEVYNNRMVIGLDNLPNGNTWTSTEVSATDGRYVQMSTGDITQSIGKGFNNFFRPVRMFAVEYSPYVQRIGNDSVYGTGSDGNTIIAANTALSRDMYYNNLTINNGVMLNTNGFRVFVKNTLTLNGNIGVAATHTVSSNTVSGQTPAATSTTDSLGGNAFGNTFTASTMSTDLLKDISTAILGYYIDSGSNTRVVTGGAGGGNGVAGTVTPGAAGTRTPGANGTGATPGGAGSLNRNVLAPGGPGSAGSNGSAGSTPPAAAAGSTPPAAAAGVAGAGGPVVIIVAKNFDGNAYTAGGGYILAEGKNATAGGASATGTGAGPAATGSGATAGSAGSAAPGQALAHHNDNFAHYVTGDGTHGGHQAYAVPALPHGGYYPNQFQRLHADRYVYHGVFPQHHCGDGVHDHGAGHFHTPYAHYHGYSGDYYDDIGDFHAHAPHHVGEDTSRFSNINGIPHNSGHRNQPGVAWIGYGQSHSQHVDSNPQHNSFHDGSPMYCSNYKGHHYGVPRHHGSRVGFGSTQAHNNGGTVSHVGHVHAAGGSAGSAGTPGTNGSTTAGTNGSTTAGTAGQSGGGGGIIIVTDSPLSGISTSVSGGVIGSNTASSGTVVTVLNR